MNIAVIGAGFAGLSASTRLAQSGYSVDLYEKNSILGGRARVFEAEGFRFDMGPSWYWMPDVFEEYYNSCGYQVSELYGLRQLDPGFRVYFGKDDFWDIPASTEGIRELFENTERGAALALDKFMREAKEKYDVSMSKFVHQPGLSIVEFFDPKVVKAGLTMNLLGSYGKYVRRLFKNERLRMLMDFPVLFLGASSQKTPALYSMMSYAGLYLGTWYPEGGMHSIVEAFAKIARDKGVRIHRDSAVESVETRGQKVIGIQTSTGHKDIDGLVAAGDYHHMESILPEGYRNYTENYWDKRVMSPSALLFYLGIDKRLVGLEHHTLFFDESLEDHSHEIYEDPQWPKRPLFYACCPSLTDDTVAPEGHENLFLLVPLAAGLKDTAEQRQITFDKVMNRLEDLTSQKIREHIVYNRSYAMKDFQKDYHAYKGNAYGLSNTLSQTALLKPKIINKRLDNMWYAGQLTVPGPGVPPSILSGQIAAKLLEKKLPVARAHASSAKSKS